ncbi:MAG: hypothetical protein JSU68_03685, partial [Phycisphaerales bacterium]
MYPRRVVCVIACALTSAMWLTLRAEAVPITLSVHTWSDSGPLDDLEPGALIHFQVGVSVDPTVSHEEYPGTGNDGLASVVYDIVSELASYRSYVLTPLTPAASGWSELRWGDPGFLHNVTN